MDVVGWRACNNTLCNITGYLLTCHVERKQREERKIVLNESSKQAEGPASFENLQSKPQI